jgi:hypothetical protein
MIEKLFGRLMFGFVACPHCTCRQSSLWRGGFKLNKCVCCGKVFVMKKDNFQESNPAACID